MTPLTLSNTAVRETNAPVSSPKPAAAASAQTVDSLQLSPAAMAEVGLTGRVSLDEQSGSLSSDQAQQLYGQISSIHDQIVTDRQADGGTLSATDAQAIQQLQSQLGQTIYSEAHNGAAAPSGTSAPQPAQRQALLAGRIVLNEKAGNLSSDQAEGLGSQLGAIQQQIATDEQADGGTLSATDAQAINQLQSQLSQQIRETVHGYAVGPEPIVNPV